MTRHQDPTPADGGPWSDPEGAGDALRAGEAERAAFARAAAPDEPDGPDGPDAGGAGPPGAGVDQRIAELEDRWLRSAAELENLRKRIARDAERIRDEERAQVAREWLGIVDNLDLALRHAAADPSAVVEGVRAVRDQAVALLARLGYPRHDEVGVRFDPSLHDAVGTVEDIDAQAGTVVDVVRPGYGMNGRQLRPASVIVSTRPE
ncbi:nucleotide exchange factor GrpE [Sphaerisporangium sp. TRM90804]|uniref:nucleotide exchange factor GrpE n=1 Tax=Sphaerisporangium sp. TRM90804 TaxID=3031113 RepID=UPI002448D4D1|nr:nucleotide exchange factor GrpE [Sphaerisporangium sp. TRM90804]MDH2429919.1 nucleotide exchange factor GrpE [Sphaerisporangium sp. TRM90804]